MITFDKQNYKRKIMKNQEMHYAELISKESVNFEERNGNKADSIIVPYFVYTEVVKMIERDITDGSCEIKFMDLILIPNFDRELIFKCIKTKP